MGTFILISSVAWPAGLLTSFWQLLLPHHNPWSVMIYHIHHKPILELQDSFVYCNVPVWQLYSWIHHRTFSHIIVLCAKFLKDASTVKNVMEFKVLDVSQPLSCNWSFVTIICGFPSQKLPDSKVHGANMGPTWVLSAPDEPHVGPMNLAIRARIP